MWPFSTKKAGEVEVKETLPSGLVNPESWIANFWNGSEPGDCGVSSAKALTVPSVQSAIRLLSEAAATLDVKVQKKNGKNYEDDEDHPAWDLLNRNANAWTSSFELIRSLVVEALTNDQGGFAWVNKVRGRPFEILKYGNAAIQVSYRAAGDGRPTYVRSTRELKPTDVIHIRGPFSKSPTTLARKAIGFAWELENHGANLFLNGARPGGVIETPKNVGEVGVVKMLQGWKAAFGGSHNAGKTAVLYDGAVYKQMALSSTDSQYIDNRRFQTLEICRAFRIPPSMLYDLESGKFNNVEQMGREFLSYSLEPWLKSLEGGLSRALLTKDEQKTHRILFDRDDLTRADLVSRATAISSFITSRSMSPNEARSWIDLPPYEGGNSYSNPAIDVARPANDNQPTEVINDQASV